MQQNDSLVNGQVMLTDVRIWGCVVRHSISGHQLLSPPTE